MGFSNKLDRVLNEAVSGPDVISISDWGELEAQISNIIPDNLDWEDLGSGPLPILRQFNILIDVTDMITQDTDIGLDDVDAFDDPLDLDNPPHATGTTTIETDGTSRYVPWYAASTGGLLRSAAGKILLTYSVRGL